MNFRLVLYCAVVLITGCGGQKTSPSASTTHGRIDVQRVLSWFPSDTETLLVANGPFWMSNFQIGQDRYKDHEIKSEELEKHFEGLTLQLFGFAKGLLEKKLEGKKVLFALEASRHFRPPAGLGELPFEGAALAVFEDDLDDRRDAFMKDAAQVAVRIDEVEGQKTAVFEEPSEQDVWTIFITFPQKDVVMVATNERFLRDMLARMQGAGGQRALPKSLSEWKYVNEQAQFWGIRHYDKQQAKFDPTSPFGGKKSANFPDDEAVGLTYQCDARTERRATITYVSGPRAETRKIAEGRFPATGDPERLARLHIQYRELEPGVIQSTFDLSRSEPTDLFFFIFMDHLGHAIYV